MSAAFAFLVDSPSLIVLGWTLGVILWATTAVGVLFAAWRTWRTRASAREQHRTAAVAFSTAVTLAILAPLALVSMPVPPARSSALSSLSFASPEVAPTSVPLAVLPTSGGAQHPLAGAALDAVASVAAAVWIAGVVFLTLRLFGGWLLARSIRKRAHPPADGVAPQLADRLRLELGLSSPVAVLQSLEVEAPVVIGWRRPALILPGDVTERLSPDMVSALLAHEFAHITRRDYAVNVLQSIVEVLLFFSPAVLWMSRCIRESREYCCDDAAVERCGDPEHYVNALTTLASLGTVNRARPAMGAAGPRLITRVRRLLHGDATPRFVSVRLAVFAALLLALIVSGARVTTASAARVSRLASTGARPVREMVRQDRIPFGVATEQEGSGVEFHVVASRLEAPLERVRLRNMTNQPVVGVQFVAAVERFISRLPLRLPVRLFVSETLPITIPPGETVEVSPAVINAEQVQAVAEESPGMNLQLFFGLSAVQYANGHIWTIPPNPAALRGSDVFGSSRPEIPRALLHRDADQPHVSASACRDERNRAYSLGAVVPVRGEPGSHARCTDGRWTEVTGAAFRFR